MDIDLCTPTSFLPCFLFLLQLVHRQTQLSFTTHSLASVHAHLDRTGIESIVFSSRSTTTRPKCLAKIAVSATFIAQKNLTDDQKNHFRTVLTTESVNPVGDQTSIAVRTYGSSAEEVLHAKANELPQTNNNPMNYTSSQTPTMRTIERTSSLKRPELIYGVATRSEVRTRRARRKSTRPPRICSYRTNYTRENDRSRGSPRANSASTNNWKDEEALCRQPWKISAAGGDSVQTSNHWSTQAWIQSSSSAWIWQRRERANKCFLSVCSRGASILALRMGGYKHIPYQHAHFVTFSHFALLFHFSSSRSNQCQEVCYLFSVCASGRNVLLKVTPL